MILVSAILPCIGVQVWSGTEPRAMLLVMSTRPPRTSRDTNLTATQLTPGSWYGAWHLSHKTTTTAVVLLRYAFSTLPATLLALFRFYELGRR
ncbi:hypothetical protein VTK73DRAFT_2917 [Phialemonium thermophilum]|uniref:Secreted protein n=1 Tax=Phialemonium thermophilum TaxID=223376 RepID=A0ABR3X1T9_9PEZI